MTRALCLTSVSFVALAAASLPATAQCIQTGLDVSCAADDTDGFAGSDDDLFITVDAGVTVSNTLEAIFVEDLDGVTVTNSGTIRSEEEGGVAGNNADNLTVENSGLISADNDAVRGENGLTVLNKAGATIASDGQEGVQGDNDLDLTNDGTIDAGDEGVEAALRAKIVNTGTIRGVDDAVQIQGDADITNSGEISSTEEDAIDIDSGIVVNSGTLKSTAFDGAGIDVDEVEDEGGEFPASFDLTVKNSGLIEGNTGILVDPANTNSQTIENAGMIIGTGGVALQLEGGADALVLLDGGSLTGTALFGAGDDVLDLSALTIGGRAGGMGTVFDGGDQDSFDLIDFGTLTFADVFAITETTGPGTFLLEYEQAGMDASVLFTDFELFIFEGERIALEDVVDALAPIPLPASLALMLAGLGGLAALRRNR